MPVQNKSGNLLKAPRTYDFLVNRSEVSFFKQNKAHLFAHRSWVSNIAMKRQVDGVGLRGVML